MDGTIFDSFPDVGNFFGGEFNVGSCQVLLEVFDLFGSCQRAE